MKPAHHAPLFDHLDLIRRDPLTVARLKATLERDGLLDVQLLHEHDDSCCRQEPWPVTMAQCLAGRRWIDADHGHDPRPADLDEQVPGTEQQDEQQAPSLDELWTDPPFDIDAEATNPQPDWSDETQADGPEVNL